MSLLGSIHSIFIEDLLPFDVALADPRRSAISLEIQKMNLLAIQSRKSGEIAALSRLVNQRSALVNQLVLAMDREIV